MGDDFTLADVHALLFFLRAQVSLKHFKGYNLAEHFPCLLRWYNLCSERECCRAAGKSEKELIDFHTSYMK
jgi:glutathione S-transferase